MSDGKLSSLVTAQSGRAWLVLTKAVYRRMGGATKYDDDPSSHYSWDSTVPNHETVAVGDVVLLWNEVESLGVSVIERITVGTATKRRGRCRECNGMNYKGRKTIRPIFRCQDCTGEFDDPTFEDITVTTYRSDHEQGWIDLLGDFPAKELRSWCVKPKSQHSFRLMHWPRAQQAIRDELGTEVLRPLQATTALVQHGHRIQPTRVRLGQRQFRAGLLARFGATCAFTGKQPEAVLDACHLYSYAKLGRHHEHGGILLRRDLHTLFDRGIIAVNGNGKIDVAQAYQRYPAYGSLHGQALMVDAGPGQRRWFALHWAEHRA